MKNAILLATDLRSASPILFLSPASSSFSLFLLKGLRLSLLPPINLARRPRTKTTSAGLVNTVQDPPLNSELVSSSHLLIVQNMLSTERIEVLLSKFPLDNSSGPSLNSSIV